MEFLSFNGENYIRADAIVGIITLETPKPSVTVHLVLGSSTSSITLYFGTPEEAVATAREIVSAIIEASKS